MPTEETRRERKRRAETRRNICRSRLKSGAVNGSGWHTDTRMMTVCMYARWTAVARCLAAAFGALCVCGGAPRTVAYRARCSNCHPHSANGLLKANVFAGLIIVPNRHAAPSMSTTNYTLHMRSEWQDLAGCEQSSISWTGACQISWL